MLDLAIILPPRRQSRRRSPVFAILLSRQRKVLRPCEERLWLGYQLYSLRERQGIQAPTSLPVSWHGLPILPSTSRSTWFAEHLGSLASGSLGGVRRSLRSAGLASCRHRSSVQKIWETDRPTAHQVPSHPAHFEQKSVKSLSAHTQEV